MKLIRIFRSRVVNLYFICFINGILICMYVNFKIADDYENRVFASIAKTIATKTNSMPEDSVLAEMVHATHLLVGSRSSIFNANESDPQFSTTDFSESLSGDLMTAHGACGSYSKVMAKLAEHLGFESRIGQMKVKGQFGGHIIPEVRTSTGWIVTDPMFDLVFKNPDGKPAGFSEVSGNWSYYKQQVPQNYQHDYKYEAIRYTNWEKIPVIMPLIKKALDKSLGEERANAISIRVRLLSIYNIYSLLLLFVMIPMFTYLFMRMFEIPKLPFSSGYNWGTPKFPVLAKMLEKAEKKD